jgi:protein-S-isoprenylcysteine O-methyltransferase Ste14
MPVYLRTLIFTIVAPGLVAGLVPWLIVNAAPGSLPFEQSLPFGAFRHLGWLLVGLGAAGYYRCAFHFTVVGKGTPNPLDPPKHFVAVGLYLHVRNPMYVTVGTAIAGEALLLQNANILLYLGALWLMFHGFVRIYEEPHLTKVFGREYEDYCARVPRWIPRLRA